MIQVLSPEKSPEVTRNVGNPRVPALQPSISGMYARVSTVFFPPSNVETAVEQQTPVNKIDASLPAKRDQLPLGLDSNSSRGTS